MEGAWEMIDLREDVKFVCDRFSDSMSDSRDEELRSYPKENDQRLIGIWIRSKAVRQFGQSLSNKCAQFLLLLYDYPYLFGEDGQELEEASQPELADTHASAAFNFLVYEAIDRVMPASLLFPKEWFAGSTVPAADEAGAAQSIEWSKKIWKNLGRSAVRKIQGLMLDISKKIRLIPDANTETAPVLLGGEKFDEYHFKLVHSGMEVKWDPTRSKASLSKIEEPGEDVVLAVTKSGGEVLMYLPVHYESGRGPDEWGHIQVTMPSEKELYKILLGSVASEDDVLAHRLIEKTLKKLTASEFQRVVDVLLIPLDSKLDGEFEDHPSLVKLFKDLFSKLRPADRQRVLDHVLSHLDPANESSPIHRLSLGEVLNAVIELLPREDLPRVLEAILPSLDPVYEENGLVRATLGQTVRVICEQHPPAQARVVDTLGKGEFDLSLVSTSSALGCLRNFVEEMPSNAIPEIALWHTHLRKLIRELEG